jgi:2'-5' RNA ligase
MRTFIAIPLPAEARALLGELQSKLRPFGAEVKWTSTSAIHLTLKFLGEIDPAVLPRLAKLLREATVSELPFQLRLHGVGGFPSLRNPRVIWCGLEGDLQELASLQKKVEAACLDAGCAPEERPFQPHLTLGRVRGKRNLQPLLDYIKIGSAEEHAFVARELNIYQSVLRPQGAVYTVLEKIELKGK